MSRRAALAWLALLIVPMAPADAPQPSQIFAKAAPIALPCPTYRVEDIRVIDGDTFRGQAVLPFGTLRDVTLRIVGFDAPERSEPGGAAATAALAALLASGEVRVGEPEGRSFARHVCRVYARCSNGRGVAVDDAMRAAGHAEPPNAVDDR